MRCSLVLPMFVVSVSPSVRHDKTHTLDGSSSFVGHLTNSKTAENKAYYQRDESSQKPLVSSCQISQSSEFSRCTPDHESENLHKNLLYVVNVTSVAPLSP